MDVLTLLTTTTNVATPMSDSGTTTRRWYVRTTGGDGPSEYPSAKLLARAVALLGAAVERIGALAHGECAERAAAAAAEISADLDAATHAFERGGVAIELELAQQASWTAMNEDAQGQPRAASFATI